MKNIYNVIDRQTKTYLTEPTFERDLARGNLQTLKQQGIDAVIKASKIDINLAKRVR